MYVAFIDAGHSKATGGKRNTIANPKFYEYEFNNDIAVKLKLAKFEIVRFYRNIKIGDNNYHLYIEYIDNFYIIKCQLK